MVQISFQTLLANGSQTITDADGDEVTVTATFNGGFIPSSSGSHILSDWSWRTRGIDLDPDSFTLSFSKPVKDFTFEINDLNSGSFWQDSYEIEANLDGAPVVTDVALGTSGTSATYTSSAGNSPETESVTVQGPFNEITVTSGAAGGYHGYLFFDTADIGNVVCLTAGTLIETKNGPVEIEHLSSGDLVVTKDNGLLPIRWIGKKKLSKPQLEKNEKLRPVRIQAGALGNDQPQRDLLVSRQHRMLVDSKVSERMFGRPEVLVPAIKLTALPGVFVDDTVEEIEYFHILFDTHEIIYAEGTPTESLFTGEEALRSLPPESREEILAIFPEISEIDYTPRLSRFVPEGKLQKQLVARHLKNNTPVLRSCRA
ncbi:Hint domain-containing protein [Aliiroseovarius halocynthiae]|uniref:Hint domain-containing protein n=1 Tax=Aliiroseovarius halocynthiae TaxID=985055 RepID=A0A545SNK6_9RHOB|nr:Hint domain-containing protein [Aliiroseovarius halocynthiae]TQV66537.1 Hint domain-containing protein [Aliiroseovarius halocynthiae]SMR82595.1 Hint domain-containing protein [Aliiroseovarius halocynthiae]